MAPELTDPVKLAQIEGQLNLANERLGNVDRSLAALSGSFTTWKEDHENDNAEVERDLGNLRTKQETSDRATRNTLAVCTMFLSVIGGMFCWFLNDKIDYMREADARIERQHDNDMLLANKRIDSVEAAVSSNTKRIDQAGLMGVRRE